MIDGSIVKVHQDAMRSAYCKKAEHIGSSVGGLSTKIHAKVDALGGLLRIELSEGQRHESQMADRIFDGEACDYLLADRTYDSNSFRSNFKNHGVIAFIPSKKNRVLPIPHDCHIYKERHAVECFFQKNKTISAHRNAL
jgi:transposase